MPSSGKQTHSVKTGRGKSNRATLDPVPFPELVFALVGPAGTDVSNHVPASLKAELEGYGYRVEEIRLSKLIEHALNKNYQKRFEDERISALMKDGTRLRERAKRGDAIAILSVAEIRSMRKKLLQGRSEKNAFILVSIKHPGEITTLRNIYDSGFFAISIYTPRAVRVDQLAEKIAHSRPQGKANHRTTAESLIMRDEQEEGHAFGQNVREAFPNADFFLEARSKQDIDREIKRFIELVFGNQFRTPTRDEYAMYHAKAGAMRSSDLGRQVGAVIATQEGDVIAVGCNDVPKPFGGLYWEGDLRDARDFQKGIDSSATFKERMLTEMLSRLQSAGWIGAKYRKLSTKELVQRAEKAHVLDKVQLAHLLEFGRAVHAEMAALMDAAKRGVAVEGATLYSTTFPCHICSKHIVAAGISRVVYIEPYPKSKAEHLYSDSIAVDHPEVDDKHVSFVPFVGVAPRQYLRLFEAVEDRKDKRGKPALWKKRPKMTRFKNSYLDVETKICSDDLAIVLNKVRTKTI